MIFNANDPIFLFILSFLGLGGSVVAGGLAMTRGLAPWLIALLGSLPFAAMLAAYGLMYIQVPTAFYILIVVALACVSCAALAKPLRNSGS